MDEDLVESDGPTVGERLRSAREARGLSLEDVAAQTRIPQRHLESIESAEWDKLPAPTYTVGFAKSYASTVGLDRSAIGDQLREEMGGQRFAHSQSEVIEAADPARTMPKWLVIGAVIAIIAIVLVMSWFNHHSLQQSPATQGAASAPEASAPAPSAAAPITATPQGTPQGPVVLSATAPAWIEVTDEGKHLFQGELQPGQTYTVPANATAPRLKAGKPEALKIMVGSQLAPPVGPPGKVVSKVSLKPADLMHGDQQPTTVQPTPAQAPKPISNDTGE